MPNHVKRKRLFGMGVLLTMLISITIFGAMTQIASAAAINAVTNTELTPGSQFTTFVGVPVYRLHVANTGDTADAITSLSPTPSGSVVDTTVTLHFYHDANDNGIVDQGDTDLGASAAFGADDTKQAFNITDVTVPVGGSASILITADIAAGVNAQVFNLSFALPADIAMTVAPTGTFPLLNDASLTVSSTAPAVTVADGANDPAAKTVKASAANVAVKQLAISAATGTSDSIVSLALTPAGTENDATNITSVVFYIDSGSVPGQVDGTDVQLVTTPSTYTTDNTKQIFTFSSPVQITAGASVNILVVYNLGAGVVDGNILTATIALAGDVVAGSSTPVTQSSTISSTITIDTIAPTVAINQAGAQADPTNASPINFTVVFSESTTDFATGDVTLSGTAGATTGTVTGSGTTYNVAVTGMTGDGTVIATIGAGVATDAAGNSNTASTSTDNTVTYDTTAPTGGSFTINSGATYTTSQTVNTLNVTCPTDAWTTVEMAYGNTAAPTNWTTCAATVSSYDLGAGQGVKTVYMRFRDGGLNTTSDTTDTITMDTIVPSVTINQAGAQADPTNGSPINFTVVFSESTTDFATGDVTLAGTATGTLTGTVTGSGTTYNVAVSGMTGDGTVIATIDAGVATDAAGNSNTASTSTDNTVTYDTTPPSGYTIAIDQGAYINSTNETNTSFTFTGAEVGATYNYSVDDTNGGTPAVTGTGTVATVGQTIGGINVSSLDDDTLTYAVVLTDPAGNTGTAATDTIIKDSVNPTVTINAPAVINNANKTAYTLTGTCSENGRTVTVSIGGVAATPTCGTLAWTTGAIDVSAALDNVALPITADHSDTAGNNATQATTTVLKDTVAPAISSVFAVQQTGVATTLTTNLWYFYGGDNLRFRVTSDEALSDLKACVRSITGDDSSLNCTTEFGTGTLNTDFIQTAANVGGFTYEFNTALGALAGGGTVTNPDGYPMNLAITDAAGNVTYSTGSADSFVAALNVDPKVIYTGTPSINNATTTDWSAITDFTNVTNLVFNANDGVNDVGRLTITGPLDLTSLATIDELSNLNANMIVTGDQGDGSIDVKIDSTNLSIFDTGATVMIRVPTAVQPGIVVRDDADVIAGFIASGAATGSAGGDNLTAITWDGGAQTLTFNTDGFTSFGLDQTAPTATISPANGATGVATTAATTVTFDEEMDTSTFTYTLTPDPGGTSVTWDGTDTIATIAHNAYLNSTAYTLTVTGADDMSGNSTAGATSTFTTVAVAPATGGGGGSAGGSSTAYVAPSTTTADEAAAEEAAAEETAAEEAAAAEATTEEPATTEATQQEVAAAEEAFTDITFHWATDYIARVYADGYIQGYEDQTFKPDQGITRAEASKLIAMWLNGNLTDADCDATLFTDVSCNDWHGKFVSYLRIREIIMGYEDGSFGPDQSITRAEALKIMIYAKMLQNTDISGIVNPFSDVSTEEWFHNIVMIAHKLSIVEGYQDGTFGPNNSITRAEFTKIFVETLLNN